MIIRNLAVMIVSSAIAFSSGCAFSGGAVKYVQAPDAPLSPYESLEINIDSLIENSGEEINALKILLSGRWKSEGEWEITPAGDLSVNITITHLKKVTKTDRLLWGAFAGRAEMSADVVVTEQASRKIIRHFTAEGKSSGGTIFAGDTIQAVDKLSASIAEGLSNKTHND